MAAAQNLVTQVQRTTTTPATAALATGNQIVITDYYIGSGTQCGPRTITGWTENVDFYRDATPAVNAANSFTASTGIFQAPVAGYYKICASSRSLMSGRKYFYISQNIQVPQLRQRRGHVHQERDEQDRVFW